MKTFDETTHLEMMMLHETSRFTLAGYIEAHGDFKDLVFSVNYKDIPVAPVFTDSFRNRFVVHIYLWPIEAMLGNTKAPQFASADVPKGAIAVYLEEGKHFNPNRAYYYGRYAQPLSSFITAKIHIQYIFSCFKRWMKTK